MHGGAGMKALASGQLGGGPAGPANCSALACWTFPAERVDGFVPELSFGEAFRGLALLAAC